MIVQLVRETISSIVHYPVFLYGLCRLLKMPKPIVTVFGGKYAQPESLLYDKAYRCGRLLAQQNVSILTGGGPGIMEAVLCGVDSHDKNRDRALGIGVSGIDIKFHSKCGYHYSGS